MFPETGYIVIMFPRDNSLFIHQTLRITYKISRPDEKLIDSCSLSKGKDPDAGKDLRAGGEEDEMVG